MRKIQQLLALVPLFAILACTDATLDNHPTDIGARPPADVNASINVGYGPDLFYYLRHDPASFNFSTFGTISTSGTNTDRFGVGSNFDALTFTASNVGYGTNLFYYVRHNPASFNFSTFGTISSSGATTDRFGVGSNFDALAFAGPDLGYGSNLFYYLRHNPAAGNASTFGTISTSGAVVDRFTVGTDFDALVFVAADLGYGPNLFYYLRHSGAGNFSTFGTISPTGTVTDRFGVGSNFDALAFAPSNVGYGASLFYFLRHDPASSNFSTFGTISVSGSVTDRFGVGYNFDALTFPASPPSPQAILFTSTPPDPAVIGDTYAVTATGGGTGNAVTFSTLTANCSVLASTVTFLAAGTCTVAANQAGSAAFDPAPQLTQSFEVKKISQVVSFTSRPPQPAIVGDIYLTSAAGGDSGSPVIFSSQTPSTCTVSGFSVTLIRPGTCSVAADQAGSATYDAAPTVAQTFTVTTIGQLISDTRNMLQTLNLEREIAKSLDGKLAEALKSLGKNQTKEVCNGLRATLNQISAQTGKKLTLSQSAALTEQINLIRQRLGC